MTIVQARMAEADVRVLDADAGALGLPSRSAALREGLRLLHQRARHAALAGEYDEFYGPGAAVPMSEVAAAGDRVAVESMRAGSASE
jgi:Arc/MetJ-type ribon-helix-helix transcriptional regulator